MSASNVMSIADVGRQLAGLMTGPSDAATGGILLFLNRPGSSDVLAMRTAQLLAALNGRCELVSDDPAPVAAALRRLGFEPVNAGAAAVTAPPARHITLHRLADSSWQPLLEEYTALVIAGSGTGQSSPPERLAGATQAYLCCGSQAIADAMPNAVQGTWKVAVPVQAETSFTPFLPVDTRSATEPFSHSAGLLRCGPCLPAPVYQLDDCALLEVIASAANLPLPALPTPRALLQQFTESLNEAARHDSDLFSLAETVASFTGAASGLENSLVLDTALSAWQQGDYVEAANSLDHARLDIRRSLPIAIDTAAILAQTDSGSSLRSRLISTTIKQVKGRPEDNRLAIPFAQLLLEYADHHSADIFTSRHAAGKQEMAARTLDAYERAAALYPSAPERLALVRGLLLAVLGRPEETNYYALSDAAGDPLVAAAILNNHAVALRGSDSTKAIDLLSQATALLENQGDEHGVTLYSLVRINHALLLAGRIDPLEAIEKIEAAIAVAEARNYKPLGLALRFQLTRLQAETDQLTAAQASLTEIETSLLETDRVYLRSAIANAVERVIQQAARSNENVTVLAHYQTLKEYRREQPIPLQQSIVEAMAEHSRQLYENGEREQALELFNQLVGEFSPHLCDTIDLRLSEAWHTLSQYHAGLGQSENEIAAYESQIKHFSGNTHASIMERVLSALRNHTYQMIRRAKASLHSAKYDHGIKQLAAAEQSLQGVMVREGNLPQHLATLGYIQYLLQNPAKAKMTLLRAILEGGEPMREVALEFEQVIPLAEDRYFRNFLDKLKRPDYSHRKIDKE